MNEDTRHERILDFLRDRPFASVRDLADDMQVSAATIRRDIDKLDEAGRARKVYGGISAIEGSAAHSVFSRTYDESQGMAIAVKRAIADHAAAMVQDGDSVVVHGGSTCFHLGERIANRNIRLCTNSMPLAAMLGEQGSCALTIVGGQLHREPRIIHGPDTTEPFYASKYFLSAQGANDSGLLESHPLLVESIQRFAERADRIVALVDSSKFEIGARKLSLPWSRVDTLVTDSGLSEESRAMLQERGVELQVVEVAGE